MARTIAQMTATPAGWKVMAQDTSPDLDPLELEAGQRLGGHRLGQFDAAQEGG